MKTLSRTALLLLFLGIIPLSCCDEVREYYQPNAAEAVLVVDNHMQFEPTTADPSQFIFLTVSFYDFSYVASTPSISLILTAMATSCPHEGMNGFKYPISAITISSKQDFLGRSAGSSLNDYFGPYIGFDQDNQPLEMSYTELYENLNSTTYQPPTPNFYLKNKTDTTAQEFIVEISFEDGTRFRDALPELRIQ